MPFLQKYFKMKRSAVCVFFLNAWTLMGISLILPISYNMVIKQREEARLIPNSTVLNSINKKQD